MSKKPRGKARKRHLLPKASLAWQQGRERGLLEAEVRRLYQLARAAALRGGSPPPSTVSDQITDEALAAYLRERREQRGRGESSRPGKYGSYWDDAMVQLARKPPGKDGATLRDLMVMSLVREQHGLDEKAALAQIKSHGSTGVKLRSQLKTMSNKVSLLRRLLRRKS